jgi:thiamine transporter
LQKPKIPRGFFSFQVSSGSWLLSRLRGQLFVADPMNLTQVILAEGQKMNKPNQRTTVFSTKLLAEIIVMVALAGALSLVSHSFFNLPQGGSINLGMVPILWLALRRGWKVGVFAGAMFGMVDLAISPFVVHPVQLILDYPLPFACLGLAGFFQKWPVIGVGVGVAGRFICHFLSGVIYFPMYAPQGMSPILYSAIYNATYLIPSFIVCALIIGLLQKSKTINIYL